LRGPSARLRKDGAGSFGTSRNAVSQVWNWRPATRTKGAGRPWRRPSQVLSGKGANRTSGGTSWTGRPPATETRCTRCSTRFWRPPLRKRLEPDLTTSGGNWKKRPLRPWTPLRKASTRRPPCSLCPRSIASDFGQPTCWSASSRRSGGEKGGSESSRIWARPTG
jgi:hypothetical protein